MSAYPVLLSRPLLAGFTAGVLISLGACSAANPDAPSKVATAGTLSDQARDRAELHEQLAAVPAELQRKSQVTGRAVMPSVAYAPMPMSVQADAILPGYRDENREQYQKLADNPVHAVAETPVSTFSIDVDTGSYANVRRFLNGGQLPPQEAVRLEELVNYFPYAYPLPKGGVPFGVHTELAVTPWNSESRLLRIAIKTSDLRVEELPPANLVFLVDVSGSMDRRDGLPMVQSTLKLLVEQLRAQDKVSLVVYAGSSSVVLQPTSGSDKAKIRAAIDKLTQLADAGDGNYAYIDNLREARKVLVDQLSSTLAIVASDVKIQVEFNPAQVSEYRLLGYENRALKREDFSNDKVDAGEIGAGHSVTALYEVVPVGGKGWLHPLRYQAAAKTDRKAGELAWLRIRYKAPGQDVSKLLEQPIQASAAEAISQASEDLRFAAAVAAFAQQLKGEKYTGRFSLADSAELARNAKGTDRFGLRAEFVQLVELAQSLQTATSPTTTSRVQQ